MRTPRLVSPKRTVPLISVMTAGLDGFRASNNSATRGNPPVISRVLPISLGILTKVCPRFTFCLLVTTRVAFTGRMVPPANILPVLSIISM